MESATRRLFLALLLAWAPGAPAAETLYRLPWPDGLAFMFTQAPGGRITTHISAENLHAVDIAMPEGTAVIAARDGMVDATDARHGATAEEEPLSEYGNFVRVRHEDGTVALYAHLRHGGVAVRPGDAVAAGSLLGYSGASGDLLAPQLHFGVARVERTNGREDFISLPFRFHVGRPPIAFAPKAGQVARAEYAGQGKLPYTALEAPRLAAWKPRVLTPEEQPLAWLELAAWIVVGITGMAWFWRFSRR